jgi:hypothetical protein
VARLVTLSRGERGRGHDHLGFARRWALCRPGDPYPARARLVLAPLVRRLEGWGLPNAFAVPAVIVVLLAALFGGATVAGREVTQLLEEVPQHEANLREKARFLHFELGRRGVGEGAAATPRSVEQEITDKGKQRAGTIVHDRALPHRGAP